VIDAMQLAVTQRRPFRRYFAGHDTYAFRLLAALPDCAADWLWDVRHDLLRMPRVVPPGVLANARRAAADKKAQ
jgi:hypothetical protein